MMFANFIPKRIKRLVKSLFFKEKFTDSQSYWQNRYLKGGNSGTGSYDQLAEFKAEIINSFVKENNIETVVEYGCGDGNQLRYYDFKKYLGYDVSSVSVKLCSKKFENDLNKTFRHTEDYRIEQYDLAMSIDVVYHLIEDEVFEEYMKKLFNNATKYVIIYSSNVDLETDLNNPHVKQRQFTNWVTHQAPGYKLLKYIKNKYPYNGDEINSSISDFYIYRKEE